MLMQYRGESDEAYQERVAENKTRWRKKIARMIADWGGIKGPITCTVKQDANEIVFTVKRKEG